MWLPLAHFQLGTWPATQARAPTGNWTSHLLVCKPVPHPLSHTSQGYTLFFNLTINAGNFSISDLLGQRELLHYCFLNVKNLDIISDFKKSCKTNETNSSFSSPFFPLSITFPNHLPVSCRHDTPSRHDTEKFGIYFWKNTEFSYNNSTKWKSEN